MDRLTFELHSEPEPENEAAWAEEAEHRLAEIRSGKVQPIPGEEVMRGRASSSASEALQFPSGSRRGIFGGARALRGDKPGDRPPLLPCDPCPHCRGLPSAHALIAEVCHAPTLFRRIPCPGAVRRHFKKPFPYAVLYVDEPDSVLVLAVAPFKRRPGYWRHRLKR